MRQREKPVPKIPRPYYNLTVERFVCNTAAAAEAGQHAREPKQLALRKFSRWA